MIRLNRLDEEKKDSTQFSQMAIRRDYGKGAVSYEKHSFGKGLQV